MTRQAPKWGIGRKEKLASRASGARYGDSIFLFALYPTCNWEPVRRPDSYLKKRAKKIRSLCHVSLFMSPMIHYKGERGESTCVPRCPYSAERETR